MRKEQRFLLFLIMLAVIPFSVWLFALAKLHNMPKENTYQFIKYAFYKTTAFEDWRLIAVYLGAFIATFIIAKFIGMFDDEGFLGKGFKKHLRGTKIVSPQKLAKQTKEKNEQVTIAGIPMPTKSETVHLLLNGSTGAGKSVTLREMIKGAIERGDRLVIVDPNGDMFSKFGKKGDVLLNPFDKRTSGWSIFNEIQQEYDYRTFTNSIIPKSPDNSSEEWNGYARTIIESTMKTLAKQKGTGETPTMDEVSEIATVIDVKEMKNILAGTDAASLFSEGAEKGLGSARFVMGKRLPIFKEMLHGDFSIREFLENGKGNIYITWKESQKVALTPLISCWIDVICSSVLSLDERKKRRIWLFLDELASLDNIASLEDALTKGRKNGLRVVAGIQSVSQLKKIYGQDGATILMSCFRSLLVMGGSQSDPETSEAMSKALGEHEVIRENKNRTSGGGKTNTSRSEKIDKERVVMPSEIANLPDLTGIISFAGDYPIARFKTKYVEYPTVNQPFVDMDL